MKAIVVAMGKNREIGANNDLPWKRDLPTDMAYFKKMTLGTSIIMGMNTFKGMGALPDRQNIVLTQTPTGVPGVLSASSLEAAYALAQYDIRVVGGGKVFAETINDMDRLYITEVDAEFPEATVFFPEIDKTIWKEVSREHHDADEKNKYPFDFVVYEKV